MRHAERNQQLTRVFFSVLLLYGATLPINTVQATPKYNTLTAKEKLGRELFFDTNLSAPAGQACASCHDPKAFFTDPNKSLATSKGVIPKLRGNRNSPTVLYASFSPVFHYDSKEDMYLGGQFLDGRATTLAEQAKGPFLNPLEMANPNAGAVVNKVRKAPYARLFERVYGDDAFNNINEAYNHIADAIAAFERTSIFRPFSSKYDYFLAGKATLTIQEMRGKKLFENKDKANCAACHPSRPAEDGTPPLFTDFSYDNLGVPKNPDNPFYRMPAQFNPAGWQFIDKGLGGVVKQAALEGAFKVPTLRNIAKTAPYMHNGYFNTLEALLDFYSSRDIKPTCQKNWVNETHAIKHNCWPKPEISETENPDELGQLNLSNQEIKDIVAFLNTLTDGYKINN